MQSVETSSSHNKTTYETPGAGSQCHHQHTQNMSQHIVVKEVTVGEDINECCMLRLGEGRVTSEGQPLNKTVSRHVLTDSFSHRKEKKSITRDKNKQY